MLNNKSAHRLMLLVLAVVSNVISYDSHAEGFTLEEVVVSARRVTENLQSTPVAVSALDSHTLERNAVLDIGVLENLAPGVNIEEVGIFPGTISPFIRGIGTIDFDSTIDPAISVIIDGFYYARTFGAFVDLYDLEQVEVLRGPQGTLFGRNSLGGAINIRTARPTGEFAVRGNTTLAEFGRRDFNFAIESPITDKLSTKLIVMRRDSDTYYDVDVVADGQGRDFSAASQIGYALGALETLLDPSYIGFDGSTSETPDPSIFRQDFPVGQGDSSDFGPDRWQYKGYLRFDNDEGFTADLIVDVARDDTAGIGGQASAPGILTASNGTPIPGSLLLRVPESYFTPQAFNDLTNTINTIDNLAPGLGLSDSIFTITDRFGEDSIGLPIPLPFTFAIADSLNIDPQNIGAFIPALGVLDGTGVVPDLFDAIGLDGNRPLIFGVDNPGVYTGNLGPNPYSIAINDTSVMTMRAEGFTLDIAHETEYGDFFLNTGFRQTENRINLGDGDSTGFDLYGFVRNANHDQFNFEFRWSNQITNELSLTAGLFYLQQDYEMGQTFSGAFIFFFTPIIEISLGKDQLTSSYTMSNGAEQQQQSYAAFFSADYFITNDLRVNVAGRFNSETKDFKFANTTTCTGAEPGLGDCSDAEVPFLDLSRSWSNFSPKLGLDYQISEDTFSYVTASKAFRSGGFNIRANHPDDAGPYNPEEVLALEAGVKTEVLDGRVRINSAVFRNKYTDLQRESINGPGATRIENAAEGVIQGFETEITALVTQNLRFYGNMSLLDTSYDSFTGDANGDGISDDLSSTDFIRAPKLAYTLSLDYSLLLGSLGELSFATSYNWVDDNFHTIQNFDSLRREAGGILNADMRWDFETNKASYYARIFGTNLTDETYLEYAQALVLLGGIASQLTQPRTFGLELGFKY